MSEELNERTLRGAAAFQQLHWLATGRIDSARLTTAYRAAIANANPQVNAFLALDESAPDAARASDARRDGSNPIGRLDGLVVAIKDTLDVAGMATTVGLASRRTRVADTDSTVAARLRAAGAVIVGKTNLDEGAFGTRTRNPHFGDTQNPWRAGYTAGGSSGGSAAAVAAGLCSFAIGSDTLGSVRIPASHCGVFALKPTHGEISTRGMSRGARRLDCVGVLARSAQDLAIVLQVLDRYDESDPRSRRRRMALAAPDWHPGKLRCGLLPDLGALGVAADVQAVFNYALEKLQGPLGQRQIIDIADYDVARHRRAALLIMESEIALELADDLVDANAPVSPRLRSLIDYARSKSAPDYAAADRLIDSAVLKARRLFTEIDVLVLPTVPHGPYPLADAERANDADLTSFASIAGCPAVSLPMGMLPDGFPVGLQLVGAPGSDLRLLDLAEVCAATLDATPEYPVEA
ncbi:MAG: amidase [Dokdonella sp.]